MKPRRRRARRGSSRPAMGSRQPRARNALLATLIGVGVASALVAAQAGTLGVAPAVVPVGGSIVFAITTELGEWPNGWDGAEYPTALAFNGPCTNGIFYSFFNQYGLSFEVPFPGPGWRNFVPGCATLDKPGSYVATLSYNRLDATGRAILHHVDVPFTVLAKLEVSAIPSWFATGETTGLQVSGLNPGETMTALQVECPDGGVDSALDVSAIDEGFAVSWPGPFFAGTCNGSKPGGGYHVIATTTQQGAETYFSVFGDRDGDGWYDRDDNCPNDANPGQEDTDGDGRGDACDHDNDNDSVLDAEDNCPGTSNASQEDLDADGAGDVCDPDADEDGVPTASDNCPLFWNPGQENDDGDGYGDACDPDPDDNDGDGLSDLVDNCWQVFNPAQQDDDGDGIGTACDPDIDGDGISNQDEATAGTNANDPQPIPPGSIHPFWEGGEIAPEGTVPEGEAVGVVIHPGDGVAAVGVTVFDPWGGAYAAHTLVPQSPVAFYFVPIWPGIWTIEAEPSIGDTLTAHVHVVPEPGPLLAGAAAVLALLAARTRCVPKGMGDPAEPSSRRGS